MNSKEEYVDLEGRPTFHTQCTKGHPLWLVAEGYGYCRTDSGWFIAWRFTNPGSGTAWYPDKLWDGSLAWVHRDDSKYLHEILNLIEADMRTGSSVPEPAPTYAEWLATVS
jgi:hypothetical protein